MRTKKAFKVITGAEYQTFCKIRHTSIRKLDAMTGKLKNMELALELLQDAKREISREMKNLQNALGVTEFYSKKKGTRNER